MAPPNPPAAQPRRRIELLNPGHAIHPPRRPPQPLRRRHLKYVFAIIAMLFFVKVGSFHFAADFHCAEHGGLLCWNTPPRVTDLDILGIEEGGVRGRDIPPPCENSFEDGAAVCRKIVEGVCVIRSCLEVNGVDEENTAPPTEELSGTPTVDKASSSWWSRAQRVQESGAACTGTACTPEDEGKSAAVKRQFIGTMFPPGWIAGTQGLSSRSPLPSSTTTMKPQIDAGLTNGTHVNETPTGEIPLHTSGETRGVGWNSCASSAALLGLVAIGVVVLL